MRGSACKVSANISIIRIVLAVKIMYNRLLILEFNYVDVQPREYFDWVDYIIRAKQIFTLNYENWGTKAMSELFCL